MSDHIAQEVKEALTTAQDHIPLEPLQKEDSSPLNHPVIEKDIGGALAPESQANPKHWNVWKPEQDTKTSEAAALGQDNDKTDFRRAVESDVAKEKAAEPLDAPEQTIGDTPLEQTQQDTISDHTTALPQKQANAAADAILGVANNVIAVGGGYFVKINKHKAFYEFDEIIEIIDNQNAKNTTRLKLDKEDQALLRPLLAQVLQHKSKQLTPEQQLMGAVVSILMKKAQVVLEVRAENAVLEQRILEIVSDEKAELETQQHTEEKQAPLQEAEAQKEVLKVKEPEEELQSFDTTEDVISKAVLEVATSEETPT